MNHALSAGAYDGSGTQIANGGLTVALGYGSLVHTNMSDGGFTVSATSASNSPFYTALVQRYDAAGHPVGQVFEGQYESGSPNNYSITPLASGNYVALFLDGDHFTNRKGPVVDAQGHVLNNVVTGFNAVATAGAQGGFVTAWDDVGSSGDAILHVYDNSGGSKSNDIHMLGPIHVTAEANGKLDANWDDFGTPRSLVLDPAQTNTLTGPAPISMTAWDDYGPQTGQISSAGTTDDATPTLRVAVHEAGEVVVSLSHYNDFTRTEVHTTDADLARGYVEVTLNSSYGDGPYSASARFLDANGLTSPRVDTYWTLNTSPPPSPPPPSSGGQTLQGQPGGSNLTGGSGDDTLIGGSGPDTMTGAGGGDHFVWNSLPWSPGHVTDFTDGSDKLDLSGLLSAYLYSGSDPVADGWVKPIDDGQGDTWIYFDSDGRGSADQWGTFVTTLDHVSAGSITSADLAGGTTTSPPPTSPPPTSPPPSSGGQTLQGQDGGSNLQGGAGDDTLIAGRGPDTMTGGAGADHFAFQHLVFQPGHITDFTSGTDKIDVTAFLGSYSGSDPIADGYVKLIDDGNGDTWLYLDTDGHGSADQWGTFLTTIDHVAASQIHAGDLVGYGGASPPPPPPQSPPPSSNDLTIRAQDGGWTLHGASGNDTLIGAHGPDVMTGESGNDHFEFDVLPWSAAQITDFTQGADHIDVSRLLSAVGYAGADPIADGYVKLVDDGHGNTWLYFDTDGHGSADAWGTFVATLDGVSAASLSGSDFIFH